MNVDQVLEAVRHFSPSELREFQRRLAELQNGQAGGDEALLIARAKSRLRPADVRRFKRLMSKSERGTLSAKEQAEYQTLAQQSEQLDVLRLEALTELARRHGQTVAQVRAELAREGDGDGA